MAASWLFGALLLFAVAIVYFLEPSSALPRFLPGHEAGSDVHQIGHAVVAAFFAIAMFFGSLVTLASRQPGSDDRPAAGHIHSVPPRR